MSGPIRFFRQRYAYLFLIFFMSPLFLSGQPQDLSLDPDHPVVQSPFGKRVLVFDPSMDRREMQEILDALHQQQAHRQFGSERYALLFKPGTYDLTITVDYYVHAAGLGQVPSDVRINGAVQSVTTTRNNNVTVMFWRAAENFQVRPPEPDSLVFWAVSQAAPYRRMHILGDLQLDKGGWASGGLLANSIIEGEARLTTGQQWFTRNSELGSWSGGNWNRTFAGTVGTPSVPWPEAPNTIVDTVPVVRDKPFLQIDEDGRYCVFVPSLSRQSRGVSWKQGPEPGERIPIEQFHIAFPEKDNAASINAALKAGRHLLFTPGIYELDDTLRVTRPDSVILGLGLPTLVPTTGKAALVTDDVPGIKLAGLMVDAGPVESPSLIEIGPAAADADHSGNPASLHDIFCRVGGAIAGKTVACLVVNSNHVIIDHTWLWRADHGAGAEWEVNTAANGLIVNGHDVTVYGLFNEHFQEYQTLWNGERGRTYFYQSEIPYDPPSQEAWRPGSPDGYASYKVADHVEQHQAWGLGIYSFLGIKADADPGVRLKSAVECPEKPGISITHITLFAKGYGGIDHPLNNRGPSTTLMEKLYFKGLNPNSKKADGSK